jgi:hypothetical protein
MKKIIGILSGAMAALVMNSPAFGIGIHFNMVLNFIPNPASCMYFINSGALYMEVNPGLPDTITGGGNIRALVTSNSSVSFINARPGYTVVVPALNEEIFCSARCALTQDNCWRQCRFAVRNFYSVQKPTYAVPNGTVFVRCPTLTMSKYPYYPNDPYTQYPYNNQ